MQSWLYDISERIEALESVLDEQQDKSIEAEIKTALMGIYESDIPSAIYDGIGYIKMQDAQIKSIAEEIKRLQDVKKARENRLARVKKGYTEFLMAVGQKKVETSRGTMTVVASTGKTIVDDINILPDEFKRTTIEVKPDADAIKASIKAGNPVRGAHLEESHSIRIK